MKCSFSAVKLEEQPTKTGTGALDKWVIIALTVVCLALVIALVYIALTIRGKQKQQGLRNALLPWIANAHKSPQWLNNEHRKLNTVPKSSKCNIITSFHKEQLPLEVAY